MADAFESLNLIDSAVLRQLREGEWRKEQLARASTRNGVDFGSATAGAFLGNVLRQGLVKAGLVKDEAAERAEKVGRAKRLASLAVASTPAEMRAEDPLEDSISQRMELMRELQRAGLTDEADAVRGQILDARKQQLEMRKLMVDMGYTEARTAHTALETAALEATAPLDIVRKRADAAKAVSAANVALGTEQLQVQRAGAEFQKLLEDMEHNRNMRPFLQSRARADARIAEYEARVGGSVPTLAKLQTERDYWLEYAADNPDSPLAQRRLTELTTAIETEVAGTQRVLTGPLDPTTAVRTDLQRTIANLGGITGEVNNLVTSLERVAADQPFGATANIRSAAGGYIAQGLSLLGVPASAQDAAQRVFMHDDEEKVRSQARQLHTSLTTWLAQGNMREVHRKAADDLLQALDDPAITTRGVMIAMNNFLTWATDKQKLALEVLETDLGAAMPGGYNDPALDEFQKLLMAPE